MDDAAALVSLGLTEYGARSYAALVGLGPSTAAQVAEAAQVPRTKVYAVLDDLARDQWVEVVGGRPKTFRPVNPTERIRSARDGFLERVEQTERRLAALYHQDGIQFGGPMWVVAGAPAIHRRLRRMIDEARLELFVSLAFPVPGDENLRDVLEAAGRRGVRIRMLVPHDEAPPPWTGDVLGELRRGVVPIRVIFVDDKQAMLAFRRDHVGTAPEYKGIWNPHADMVSHLREVTDRLWAAAAAAPGAPRAANAAPEDVR